MSDRKNNMKGKNLNFLFIVGLILAILTIIFAIQNSETTLVRFLGLDINPPTAFLIIMCIALGSAITLMFSIPGWFARRREQSRLQHELKDLRKNYEELAAVQPSRDAPAASPGLED